MKIKLFQIKQVASNLKTLPRDKLLQEFANELKQRQLKCTAKGNPITEEELVRDLTADYKLTGFIYRGAGVTLEALIEVGKQAIADTTGVYELPRPVRNAVEKYERNQPCPCGSGKKYKKCCGK